VLKGTGFLFKKIREFAGNKGDCKCSGVVPAK